MRHAMHSGVAVLLLILMTVPVVAQPQTAAPAPPPDDAIGVSALLDQVRNALTLSAERAPGMRARLASVTLTLQTVAVKDRNNRVTFFILQFGSRTTTTSTSKVSLTISRPDAATTRSAVPPQPLAKALADAIVAGWQAQEDARGAIAGLEKSEVTCEISFGVRKEGQGGLTLTLAPITIEGGRTSAQEAVQTVTVTFRATSKQSSN